MKKNYLKIRFAIYILFLTVVIQRNYKSNEPEKISLSLSVDDIDNLSVKSITEIPENYYEELKVPLDLETNMKNADYTKENIVNNDISLNTYEVEKIVDSIKTNSYINSVFDFNTSSALKDNENLTKALESILRSMISLNHITAKDIAFLEEHSIMLKESADDNILASYSYETKTIILYYKNEKEWHNITDKHKFILAHEITHTLQLNGSKEYSSVFPASLNEAVANAYALVLLDQKMEYITSYEYESYIHNFYLALVVSNNKTIDEYYKALLSNDSSQLYNILGFETHEEKKEIYDITQNYDYLANTYEFYEENLYKEQIKAKIELVNNYNLILKSLENLNNNLNINNIEENILIYKYIYSLYENTLNLNYKTDEDIITMISNLELIFTNLKEKIIHKYDITNNYFDTFYSEKNYSDYTEESFVRSLSKYDTSIY